MANIALPVDSGNLVVKNGVIQKTLQVVIDDFEDNHLIEYTTLGSNVDVQSSDVYEGSYALEFMTNFGDYELIYSTSGLSAYPEQGNTFSCFGMIDDANYAEFLFGLQDSNNYYAAQIDELNQEISIEEYTSGSPSKLTSTSQSIDDQATTWYELEIVWGLDDSITFNLNNTSGTQLATISTTDGSYSSGGIGFASYNGNSFFDYVEKR